MHRDPPKGTGRRSKKTVQFTVILCFGETRRASARPRRASIAGFGNTGPLSSTEQKEKDCHGQDKLGPISEPSLRATSAVPDSKKKCHDQDKQVQGASFGFVFGT